MPKKNQTNQTKQKNDSYDNSLLKLILEDEEQKSIITKMLKVRPSEDTWRGIIATPPGTLLEDIVAEFSINSNIPLEIPFFTFFHYFAAYLLYNDINIQYRRERIRPDIWTIILAKSGSAKTFTRKCLRNSIADLKDLGVSIDGVVSKRALIELIANHNHKMLYRDEYNELYVAMLPNGKLEDCKDVFLRAYDNDDISWDSKQDPIYVQDPAFVFLGTTIEDLLLQSLNIRDITSGYMQRLSIIVAQKDKTKDFRGYHIYDINYDNWQDKWNNLIQSVKHTTYVMEENADKAYATTFRLLADIDIDESFYRRQLWKTIKYALIYHILIGKGEEKEICTEAFGWAARVAYLMLSDTVDLLKQHDTSQLQKKLEAVDNIHRKCAEKNIPFTARTVVSGTRLVGTVAEARALMSISCFE